MRAVEGLDLALFVDAEHNGVRWRVDIKPDDVAQLGHELGILGELEEPDPMRLEPMRTPDALHRAERDADSLGHHRPGPMRRLAGRLLQRQSHNAFGDILAEP